MQNIETCFLTPMLEISVFTGVSTTYDCRELGHCRFSEPSDVCPPTRLSCFVYYPGRVHSRQLRPAAMKLFRNALGTTSTLSPKIQGMVEPSFDLVRCLARSYLWHTLQRLNVLNLTIVHPGMSFTRKWPTFLGAASSNGTANA